MFLLLIGLCFCNATIMAESMFYKDAWPWQIFNMQSELKVAPYWNIYQNSENNAPAVFIERVGCQFLPVNERWMSSQHKLWKLELACSQTKFKQTNMILQNKLFVWIKNGFSFFSSLDSFETRTFNIQEGWICPKNKNVSKLQLSNEFQRKGKIWDKLRSVQKAGFCWCC